ARGSSGRYGLCNRLSVLYFPFSETTPWPTRPAALDLTKKLKENPPNEGKKRKNSRTTGTKKPDW
ncbi:hypothetical protein ACOYF0_20790, partial [Salmonella enterica subsp. enterica]|nr:hypothetical protein [Salmonella enterica]